MTTATMPRRLTFFAQADMLAMKPNFERRQNDFGKESLFIDNIAIFRSGTYKDSMGDQATYDSFAMESFVRNFHHLKGTGVFSKPVVRSGHPHPFNNGRLESVIGYINNLSIVKSKAPHDGNEYDYLMAELEIIDETAKTNIESGLWINRSAEVGVYEDNAGQEIAPTVFGVAYVDIPAVEGLNFSKNFDASSPIDGILLNHVEENVMGNLQLPNLNGGASQFTFNIGGNDTTDFSRVQGYITDLETKFASEQAKVTQFEAENKNLKSENQSLKEFQDTIRKDMRTEFVNGLAKDKKILESDKESTQAFVDTLTPEQFDAWKKTMSAAPVKAPLGDYGNSDTDEKDAKTSDHSLDTEKGIVRDLKFAGKSLDIIKKTSAYQKIIAAEPEFTV